MSINALDSKTAKFLTTAQVITSIATAVKELVENAIDARATSIEVKLVDNGNSLIEVSDDGQGIGICDTPFMALQSYTSKIKNFSDLDSLESYGFRGEALSSLCRVADVTIVTRTKDDEAARSYVVDHEGSIKSCERCHRSVGTTVKAKSLFKDLPVRRQIIMNSKRSLNEVKNLARSYAICQPKIRMNLNINGINVLTKPCTENLRETLSCLFGNKFISQIEFVEKNILQLKAFLAIPKKETLEFNDICQMGQHVFVNQRPVLYKEVEKMMNKRLVDYFGDKIPAKKKLPFIVSINVPASDLDVNLEPNKTKVFLLNQTVIMETLDETLIKFYGIVEETTDISSEKNVEIETSFEYRDSTYSESKDNETESSTELILPFCKKRKVDNSIGKTPSKITNANKRKNSNKENDLPNAVAEGKIDDESTRMETISQLPVVDLGEDFSAQDISDLPNLDAEQIETILRNKNDKIDDISMVKKSFTLQDWSKGQLPTNLRGGTNVEIYGNTVKNGNAEKQESSEPDSTSTGCKGFLKFSRETRPRIISENPGINFVEVAKSLTARWKELSPEERGYYRDLASSDANQSEKFEPSQNSTKTRVTSETADKNRKRLVEMLENMKNTKIGSNKDIKKTVVPLAIDMESVEEKFIDRKSKFRTRNKNDIVLGPINENLWIAKTGVQLWALDLSQLFQGLGIEKTNSIETSRESLNELVARWLREKDGMSLLHPIYDLR